MATRGRGSEIRRSAKRRFAGARVRFSGSRSRAAAAATAAALPPNDGFAAAPCTAKAEICLSTSVALHDGHVIDLVVAADELVEVILALHARVLVDRHAPSVLSRRVERWLDTDARGPDRAARAARAAARRRPLGGIARPAGLALAADRAAADAATSGRPGWTTRSRASTPGSTSRSPRCSSATGRAVGSTRYLALRPEHRSLEIGWTWLAPTAWGTGANAEAKLLQLEHAFDVARLPPGRVQDRRPQRARPARARGAAGRSSRASIASTCSCATARTATRPGTASSTTTGRSSARRSASAARRGLDCRGRPGRRGCIVAVMRRGWRSGRARSARRRAGCSSRSRTAASRASAAMRTIPSRRASSARRARRSAPCTRIPTASAARSCAATACTSR